MSNSSSSEEDGDAEWKAAIDSISSVPFTTTATTTVKNSTILEVDNQTSQNQLKHYQLKARKILDDILEKSIEFVSISNDLPFEYSADNESVIQLFKNAPRGIVFNHADEVQRPSKKPRLLPGNNEIDENSKQFKKELQSVAVDGIDVLAAARDASQKSLVKLEAREAAAKAAAKREEERVAELKKIRGGEMAGLHGERPNSKATRLLRTHHTNVWQILLYD